MLNHVSAVLTRNGHIALELFALGVGKKQHDPSAVLAAENSEILTDAFFAAALGLGLGHAADEHHLRAEEKLLELGAI